MIGTGCKGITTCAASAVSRLKPTTSATCFTQSSGASSAPAKVSALA
ncbi:MAG: hypothetical protein LC774_15655 [Acidobacteria bacterium]|nr:hypothetical protein [Acidobacteriota bacterium]